MRRVLLLAVLALALPMTAMANSIDYAGFATSTAANLTGGVSSGGNLTLTFHQLSVNGGAAGPGTVQISLTFGTTSCGTGCFDIAGGTVSVWNGASTLLFTGTFSSGTATELNGNNLFLSGVTTGGNTVAGVIKLGTSGWFGSSDTIVTPEPGTLGLLGTGLIGMAGLVRRKLRG
jgi:hypothetical protein